MHRTDTEQRYLGSLQSYSLYHVVRRQRAEAMASLIGTMTTGLVRYLGAISVFVRIRWGNGHVRAPVVARVRPTGAKPA